MAFAGAAECHLPAAWSSPPSQQKRRALRAWPSPPCNGFLNALLTERRELWLWRPACKQVTFSAPLRKRSNGGSLLFRVIGQAGKPKPRFSQPIRPRRRRPARPPRRDRSDPPGNILRRGAPPKEQEPYVRHPDDYYKFGPFGPYNYKADVDEPMQPATSFVDDYFFMWSSIMDLKHQEQVDFENECINYHNRVRLFDESVGLQFFYVFSRLQFHVGNEAPWKQWTLVAEITVESGEDLEKKTLMDRLVNPIRNKIAEYTSWIRPDLVFVKPSLSGFQVRFEPEMDFLRDLRSMLMKSAGEPDETESYHGLFCQILGVDLNSDSEDIVAKYEGSSEEIQLACLEHLLSNHPVELLHYVPYPNRSLWTREQTPEERTGNNMNETSLQKNVVDEAEGFDASQDGEYSGSDADENEQEYQEEDETEDWDNLDDNEINSRVTKGLFDKRYDEPESVDFSRDVTESDTEEDVGKGAVRSPYMVKAAIRPFTYVNFIREMVVLRGSLLTRKQQSRSNTLALE